MLLLSEKCREVLGHMLCERLDNQNWGMLDDVSQSRYRNAADEIISAFLLPYDSELTEEYVAVLRLERNRTLMLLTERP